MDVVSLCPCAACSNTTTLLHWSVAYHTVRYTQNSACFLHLHQNEIWPSHLFGFPKVHVKLFPHLMYCSCMTLKTSPCLFTPLNCILVSTLLYTLVSVLTHHILTGEYTSPPHLGEYTSLLYLGEWAYHTLVSIVEYHTLVSIVVYTLVSEPTIPWWGSLPYLGEYTNLSYLGEYGSLPYISFFF